MSVINLFRNNFNRLTGLGVTFRVNAITADTDKNLHSFRGYSVPILACYGQGWGGDGGGNGGVGGK